MDATFTALADPTRRAIISLLAQGDATVNELAAPFAMTLPGISKHLKVLERCGLITRSRHAQFRPCHLERAALDAAADWIDEHRRIWTERFDKLDEHLRQIQSDPAAADAAVTGPAASGAAATAQPPPTQAGLAATDQHLENS